MTTEIKNLLNALLRPLNLKIETLRMEQWETERLQALVREGHFGKPVAPVPDSFRRCDGEWILTAVRRHANDFAKVVSGGGCTPYQLRNDYYTSPDAEVLYSLTRELKPRKIVEIGAGNSTLLFREAISDEGIGTELVSIDPHPRRNISRFADRCLEARLESRAASEEVLSLKSGDFLFIDSSHEIKVGNDVVKLFLEILPALPPGVVIHIHDIFLPYEYPKEWIIQNRWPWNEQYLVQAMLQGSEEYEVFWAGHYHQKTMPDFAKHFPLWLGKDASSLWLKKIGSNC
jgi:hypothetical protein